MSQDLQSFSIGTNSYSILHYYIREDPWTNVCAHYDFRFRPRYVCAQAMVIALCWTQASVWGFPRICVFWFPRVWRVYVFEKCTGYLHTHSGVYSNATRSFEFRHGKCIVTVQWPYSDRTVTVQWPLGISTATVVSQKEEYCFEIPF